MEACQLGSHCYGPQEAICPLDHFISPVSWINQGLQPILPEIQTQGKDYKASQGHKLA